MKKLLLFALLLLVYSAIHAQDTVYISVSAVPEYGGTVTGEGPYAMDSTCIVSATPNTGFSFIQWIESDSTVSTLESFSFVATCDRELSAIFELQSFEINAYAEPSQGGTVEGDGTYNYGDTCELIANANPHYEFLNWTENDSVISNSETYSFIVTSGRELHANFTLKSYNISASAEPDQGGTVEGSGEYLYGDTCELKAEANVNYEFLYWNDSITDNPREITVLCDSVFTAFFGLKLPEVGDIIAPVAICAGESLALTEPEVSNYYDSTSWQLCEDVSFTSPMVYDGENLDATYDGWYLRYCSSNETGESYSNTVTITVNHLEPILIGSNQVCSNEETEYYVEGVGNATFLWSLSDSTISIVDNENPLKVLWAVNAKTVQISVFITDTATGCTATLEMDVNVTSHITTTTEDIIGKTKDNVTYLLLYPNPNSLTYKYQWYYNDTLIPCNTQHLYKPVSEGGLVPGNYKVYVSFNEDEKGNLICGAFSPEYIIGQKQSATLDIYPNPSRPNNEITVINEELEPATLSIYSVDGRLLHQQPVEERLVTVSLNLAKGIYIAQLKSSQNSKTGRIVIE